MFPTCDSLPAMRETIVILGGRSEIGIAVARRLAEGATVVLAARRCADLAAEVQAVRDAGAAAVDTVEFDADDLRRPARRARRRRTRGTARSTWSSSPSGSSATRPAPSATPSTPAPIVHTDYVAHVTVLTHLAEILRAQGSGTLVVFSSVAGARVRRANYVYGSAKAGLDGFASGLADALHGSGVRLLLVRPGFVIGRMTEGMAPAPFSSTPDAVADATVAALRAGRAEVWVPRALRPIFALARHAPRALWRRMPR